MRKTPHIFFILLLMLAGSNIFAQSGTIRELSGTVELKASGESSFVPAKSGDQINRDTVISTGFGSTVLVELGTTLITVRPLTRLTLAEIHSSAGAETLNLNLQAGRVRVDVNPPAGTRASMSVVSPVATASVRGTSFEFDTRNIYVSRGTVVFMGNRGGKRLVDSGSASRVEGNGRAADPVEITFARLRPKAPVGTDPSLTGTGIVSASGSVISITIRY